MRFQSPGAAPQWGVPGITCVMAEAWEGLPALLFVRDEQELNSGASATNAMERLVQEMLGAGRWGPADEVNIVEQDSLGYFDHVHPSWSADRVLSVRWTPVRWAGAAPRTVEAFQGAFGAQARRILSFRG